MSEKQMLETKQQTHRVAQKGKSQKKHCAEFVIQDQMKSELYEEA